MRNSGKRGGGAADPSDQQTQVMSPGLPHSTVPVQNFSGSVHNVSAGTSFRTRRDGH